MLRRLAWAAFALLLPCALLIAALFGLDTPTGHNWLQQQVNRSGVVQLTAIDGSLWGALTLHGVKVDTADVHLDIDRIELDWQPQALLLKRLQVDSLKVGRIDLALKPSAPDRPPSPPPQDLRVPLALALNHAEIGALHLVQPALAFSAIRFNFSSDGRQHQLELAQLVSPQGKSQASIAVDGKAPFASSGRFAFKGEVEGRSVATLD